MWPPTVCTKGEKANFRKACRPFAVKDEELFYKKVKNDETGEKVEVSDSVGSDSIGSDRVGNDSGGGVWVLGGWRVVVVNTS